MRVSVQNMFQFGKSSESKKDKTCTQTINRQYYLRPKPSYVIFGQDPIKILLKFY